MSANVKISGWLLWSSAAGYSHRNSLMSLWLISRGLVFGLSWWEIKLFLKRHSFGGEKKGKAKLCSTRYIDFSLRQAEALWKNWKDCRGLGNSWGSVAVLFFLNLTSSCSEHSKKSMLISSPKYFIASNIEKAVNLLLSNLKTQKIIGEFGTQWF